MFILLRNNSLVVTKGITLIELLIVLVIVALALAVVTPMLDSVISNSQVKTATRHLAAGLKTARNKAINMKEEITLTLDVEKNTYTIGDKNRELNLPDDTILTLTTAQSEQISEKQGAIRFFTDGSSTGGQVKLSHNNAEYVVDVNWLTGKVTIYP